ncbi:MAG: peptidase C39 bacteriocin processing [Candidatus Thiodiazotropha sp. (ex Dulcina madagascariensis)]|nr:peptidase C39 bacteriocin processing [Candidatus Thiodiazotropha sp. (ex Dulcina madagascariensis)]
MRKLSVLSIIGLGLVVNAPASSNSMVIVHTHSIMGSIPIKTWRSIRDERVVKQDLDYSCGAASIATILTEYYQRPTTEQEVLELLLKVNGQEIRASFDDMQVILPELGFRGVGLATGWEQLTKLKIPVILYVLQRKQDHFTVVSGIDEERVRLSDPSLGNRILTRGQFRQIWETRLDEGLEGKLLAILPMDKNAYSEDRRFLKKPGVNRVSTELLLLDRYLNP